MPSAITVNLTAIRVDGRSVVLEFEGGHQRPHRKTYRATAFLQVLPLLSSDERRFRVEGLQGLGLLLERDRWFLYADCGVVMNMGDLRQGPALNLLQLLMSVSPRPRAITEAIHDRRKLTVTNVFLAHVS